MLLNPDKSDMLLIVRRANAISFGGGNGLSVAGSDITFSVSLKSLGVTIDKTLSFDQHVQNIVKASNFHIRALRHIRPYMDKSVANTVACSIVNTRLDYCNAVLYGTNKTNIKKLQRVQNTLARVVSGAKWRDSMTAVRKDLHWLPIEQRIKYKVTLLTLLKVLQEKQPQYLAELVPRHQPARVLRSSSQNRLSIPAEIRSKLAEQSFTHGAAKEYNFLPNELKELSNINTFKARLKTFYFQQAYCV